MGEAWILRTDCQCSHKGKGERRTAVVTNVMEEGDIGHALGEEGAGSKEQGAGIKSQVTSYRH